MKAGDVRPLDGVQCLGYVRVSTEAQTREDKTSLSDQRAAIEAKAAALGCAVGAWFEDAGISGSTVEKRPGLLSLIASCEAQRRPKSSPGMVIALNDSRWGRFPDPEESGYWRFHLARAQWIVRFAEGDEMQDGIGRSVVRLVGAGQASEYRRNLVANTIRGARGATVQGYWRGATPPLGYVRKVVYPPGREQRVLGAGVHKAKDERVILTPDATDAAFVRRLFELYADGTHALLRLAQRAHEERPDWGWDSGKLYYLLTNRTYLGHLQSRHAQTLEPYGRDHAHEPIVSLELFDRVAARLKANRRVRRGSNRSYLVTGLVMCSVCGRPLTGSGANAKGVRFYRCNGLRAVGNPCSGSGSVIAAHRLEDAVRDVMAGEFSRRSARDAVRRHIDQHLDRLATAPAPTTDAIDRTITSLEAQKGRLVAAVASGTLSEADVRAQIRELNARLEAAQRDRSATLRLSDRSPFAPETRERLYRMVDDMPELLTGLTPSEFRQAVSPWLRSATFDRDEKRLTVEILHVPAQCGGVSFEQVPLAEQSPTLPYVTRSTVLGKPRRKVG
jgi:DNA invertase Pin-like site-specific DNA recombinase